MGRLIPGFLALLLTLPSTVAAGQTAAAPWRRTIHVRVYDGKTGSQIAPSMLIIRINQQAPIHADWVKMHFDGSAEVSVPASASVISIQASYDSSTEVYINCDTDAVQTISNRHWYKVSDILDTGVTPPNLCKPGRHAVIPDLKAKPGEFLFFVRKRSWREED
ncbi:MAG TPA: hypothetical protein VFI20_01865 [Terracidiphilus sp.]|nr:hypothetical protein [Terracidiphilus sp.]